MQHTTISSKHDTNNDEHDSGRLDACLDRMEQLSRAGDVRSCDAAWDVFNFEIERHLGALREHLAPLLHVGAESARASVRTCLDASDALRGRIAETGLLLQVHAVGADDVLSLVEMIRDQVRSQRATLVDLLRAGSVRFTHATATAA